jgi:hypothetical protein
MVVVQPLHETKDTSFLSYRHGESFYWSIRRTEGKTRALRTRVREGAFEVIEQAPELHAAISAALARLARTIARRIDLCRSMRFAGRHTEESAVGS